MRCGIALWLFVGATLVAASEELARFKEGVGITLPPVTREALKLEIAEVEERMVPSEERLTAQVYREAKEATGHWGTSSGYAYASAWLDEERADRLPPGTPLAIVDHPDLAATVLRVDRTVAAHGGRAELLIQIQDRTQPWRIGEFVRVTPDGVAGDTKTVIPSSAVLDTAYGTFAYVVNGRAFLRTPIRLGARDDDLTEVVDGLYSGDEVVTHPVETLYLIELRATKGGGHSH